MLRINEDPASNIIVLGHFDKIKLFPQFPIVSKTMNFLLKNETKNMGPKEFGLKALPDSIRWHPYSRNWLASKVVKIFGSPSFLLF